MILKYTFNLAFDADYENSIQKSLSQTVKSQEIKNIFPFMWNILVKRNINQLKFFCVTFESVQSMELTITVHSASGVSINCTIKYRKKLTVILLVWKRNSFSNYFKIYAFCTFCSEYGYFIQNFLSQLLNLQRAETDLADLNLALVK